MGDKKSQCTTNKDNQTCKCKNTCHKEQSINIKKKVKDNINKSEKPTEQDKNINYRDHNYDNHFYGATYDRIHFDYLFRRYF